MKCKDYWSKLYQLSGFLRKNTAMKFVRSFVAACFVFASLYETEAADYRRYHTPEMPISTRTKSYRPANVIPGCYESFQPIILQCSKNVVVVDDALVDFSYPLRIIPRQQHKAYPELFSWSYGGY